MSPELQSRPDADWVAQMEQVCQDLSLRIARLALVLHVPLATAQDVARVIEHPAPNPGQWPAGSAERREAERRTELRGLLLLRGAFEKRCVDEFGAATAGEMLLDVERELLRHGFRPGDDGLDLRALFGTPAA
ncbi:MAG: hypothetical protein QG612_1750 [Pseudomonadota bacterium]|nr:hypothetical protein [Pseudomonadota bacterium]